MRLVQIATRFASTGLLFPANALVVNVTIETEIFANRREDPRQHGLIALQTWGKSMADLLRDSVYRVIRGAILSCEFPPGQELREQALAKKYRVSRSPVRDSLLRLEQENLVTVLPRQGYRVNPIELHDVENLFCLRLIISPACAAEAARANDEAVRSLDRFRSGIDGNADGFIEHNRAFHIAVANLVPNTRLSAVEIALIEEFEPIILLSVIQAGNCSQIPDMVAEHRAIVDSIQQHDSDTASRCAHDHIATGRQRILTDWRVEPVPHRK